MITTIKKVIKTDLIRTSFLTSIAVLVRIVAAFVLNKVVAIYIGPVGVGVVGQFNNFFGIINTISAGGINAGVVKNIAANRQNPDYIRKVISTAFRLTLICSVVVSVSMLLFSRPFSQLVFKTEQYRFVMLLIGFCTGFAALNTLLMAFLNGFKEVQKYTGANIVSSLLILVLSILLGVYYKLQGVLVALVIGQSIVFLVTITFVVKSPWFKAEYFFRYFDVDVIKQLSRFSVMAFASAMLQPIALLVIRNYIGNSLGWEQAGYWQGVYSISEVYIMFITTSLGVYYLPRLAEISSAVDLQKEILSTAKIVLPVITVMAMGIYFFKGQIVLVLFSNKFNAMLPLFKYQLAGDVIKIAGFLITYQMLAKSMVKVYVVTELLFNFIFVALVFVFVKVWGLEGAAIAFFLNYVLYFLFFLTYFRKQIFLRWI